MMVREQTRDWSILWSFLCGLAAGATATVVILNGPGRPAYQRARGKTVELYESTPMVSARLAAMRVREVGTRPARLVREVISGHSNRGGRPESDSIPMPHEDGNSPAPTVGVAQEMAAAGRASVRSRSTS